MEFIIYCMKKNCNLKIKKSNDQEEPKKSDNLLYDLFYLNLNDYLDEYNSKKVSNPYKLMRNYMEQNKFRKGPVIIYSDAVIEEQPSPHVQ